VDTLEGRAKAALTKVRAIVPKENGQLIDELQHTLTEFRDLTSRAQERVDVAEAEGRQMVQMAGVGLMVEVVAHELARASETALASLERLRGKDLPAEIRANLETLRSEMKTVSKRLRVLDELSVSGRQRTERFDLGTTIDDILEGHAVQFTRHRIVVRWRKPKAPLMVQAVKGMVIQIIENLISNSVYWIAIRQTREPSFEGRIAVEIRSDPLIVRFSDNGRGIAPDHRDRIFQPFWSLKEKGRRRGLGLYIARENAGYLGGNLTLSDARNEFDRLHEFVLELPLSAASK
jgi:signal transduction histidine kinase